MDVVRQARTLRLLANTFLEWDGPTNWQKALSAVGECACVIRTCSHYCILAFQDWLILSTHMHQDYY